MLEQELVRSRDGSGRDEAEERKEEQRESPTTPIPGSCSFADFQDDGDEEGEEEEKEAQEAKEGKDHVAVGGVATLAGQRNRSADATVGGTEGTLVVRAPTPATLRKCQSAHVCKFVEKSLHGSDACFFDRCTGSLKFNRVFFVGRFPGPLHRSSELPQEAAAADTRVQEKSCTAARRCCLFEYFILIF